MSRSTERVVYDCNVHLQALINPFGPAGCCVEAAIQGKVLLFWTNFVAEELRRTAAQPWLFQKFKHLTADRVEEYVINIERVAAIIDPVPAVFSYARDPDDAHYVNLALAADARLVVSRDKDLLALMDAQHADGRAFRSRFPDLRILTPPAFLQEINFSSE